MNLSLAAHSGRSVNGSRDADVWIAFIREQRTQARLIGFDQVGKRGKLARRGAASELQI